MPLTAVQIQAMIDAAKSAGYGRVVVPSGSHFMEPPGLRIDSDRISLEGEGPGPTLLIKTQDYGTLLTITGDDATQSRVDGCGLKNICLMNQGPMTEGWLLDVYRVSDFIGQDVRLLNGLNGVRFAGVNKGNVRNLKVECVEKYGVQRPGIGVLVTHHDINSGGHPPCSSFTIDELHIVGAEALGQGNAFSVNLVIESADGVWLPNLYSGGALQTNVQIIAVGPVPLIGVFLVAPWLDNCGTDNFVLAGSGAPFKEIKVTAGLIDGQGRARNGVVIAQGTKLDGFVMDAATTVKNLRQHLVWKQSTQAKRIKLLCNRIDGSLE